MIVFAFGAKVNPGVMARLCPEYRTIGVARLMDYRLCFPRYSRAYNSVAASMEPHSGSAVWGVLYEVQPHDEPVLNHHEGYDPRGPITINEHIQREVRVLRMGGSEPVKAMAYFAVPDGTTARPSTSYLQSIIDGAEYHGLPLAYLASLNAIRGG